MIGVVAGWAELEEKVNQELDASRFDHGALWAEFQALAAQSQQGAVLDHLVQLGRKLPVRDRTTIVLAVTHLLAPVEWPGAWEAARSKLVNALDEILLVTDPIANIESFRLRGASSEYLTEWTNMALSHNLLVISRNLLRAPCARSELREAAQLCNHAIATYGFSLRLALEIAGLGEQGETARQRYAVAFQKYTQAARELNDACGVALFEYRATHLENPGR